MAAKRPVASSTLPDLSKKLSASACSNRNIAHVLEDLCARIIRRKIDLQRIGTQAERALLAPGGVANLLDEVATRTSHASCPRAKMAFCSGLSALSIAAKEALANVKSGWRASHMYLSAAF